MGGKEPLKTDLSLSEPALPKNTVRDDLQIPQDTEGEQGDYHYPQQDVCPFVRTQTALLHIAQSKVKNQRRKERAYAQQRRIIPPRRRKIARQKAQAHSAHAAAGTQKPRQLTERAGYGKARVPHKERIRKPQRRRRRRDRRKTSEPFSLSRTQPCRREASHSKVATLLSSLWIRQ